MFGGGAPLHRLRVRGEPRRPPVLERVIEGNEQRFDAIVIACFGDSHLQSAREISAVHMACLPGYKFSIVTVLERARPIFEELVKRTGLVEKCASIAEDGAEVICLDCAGTVGLDKPIEEQLGVPALDAVRMVVHEERGGRRPSASLRSYGVYLYILHIGRPCALRTKPLDIGVAHGVNYSLLGNIAPLTWRQIWQFSSGSRLSAVAERQPPS